MGSDLGRGLRRIRKGPNLFLLTRDELRDIFIFHFSQWGFIFIVCGQSDIVFNSMYEVGSHVGLRGVFEDKEDSYRRKF